MNLRIHNHHENISGAIAITGSKSETNRLLLLRALYPNVDIKNISNSDDAAVMQEGLRVSRGTVDIHHAGTAMRFLTAFFAVSEGKEVLLTGSPRMKERPVKILVDALRDLGADIAYENEEGYPPLRIKGKKLSAAKVAMSANVSSQYISALLLIAPSLENGLELELVGKITSVPYIKMTLALLERLGIDTEFTGNTIKVSPKKQVTQTSLTVESDWSSASYYYSIAALSKTADLTLSSYQTNSLQGDSILKEIYKELGVTTLKEGDKIRLLKEDKGKLPAVLELDLANAPDIAQTIAVSCFGLGIGCSLTGLHTLKIKETDRLEALRVELSKLGADIRVTNDTLELKAAAFIKSEVAIDTYNDHRMAMAFAPLALKVAIAINNAEVVSKSYPDFWNDLATLDFRMERE